MNRLFLVTLLLLLCSGPGYAEWVEVGSPEGGARTTYADLDTVRRKGGLVKMWVLHDEAAIRTDAGKPFWSSKALMEYNCTEEQARVLAEYAYAGQMGNGEIVYSRTDPYKWEPVMPGSIGHGMWKVACGKQ